MTETDSSIRRTSATSVLESNRMQMSIGSEAKQQIIQHILVLKQIDVSDSEKLHSLENLIVLSITLQQRESQNILKTSGIIETVQNLILETSIPRIRSLSITLIQLLQQIGVESVEIADWRTLLSPLMSLLFNEDEQISHIGCQSILNVIKVKPDSIQGLLQLNIFDIAAMELNNTFPSDSTQTSSSSSSQQHSQLPVNVVLSILEVIEKLIRASSEAVQYTNKLKFALNRVKQMNPSRQLKSAIGAILFILDDEDEQQSDEKAKQTALQEANEQLRNLQEQFRVSEQAKRDFEERMRIAEEKARNEEQLKIAALEQARNAQEQNRNKDGEIIRLQTENIQLRQAQQSIIQQKQVNNAPIEDITSELENPDSQGHGIRFECIDGMLRRVVALHKSDLSFSLNKQIKNGIHSISVKFDKNSREQHEHIRGRVGIMKASYQIPYPCNPFSEPHRFNMLFYGAGTGNISFKGTDYPGNIKFRNGQLVTLELNADCGTLHFFVDGIQQPMFVSGINEPVKFFV
ncbi:MAG: hypothetical protein EZS28_012510 [Streblomastix strix]|uniref:SPRY domain-containing protein n=1 Tax=Streblomastix strix TaxID=222440 RepID=A0A5J4WBN4_9EUKA|nr:MAG: hypothetical protein EZS28_012510 [Streblomastix strix]